MHPSASDTELHFTECYEYARIMTQSTDNDLHCELGGFYCKNGRSRSCCS